VSHGPGPDRPLARADWRQMLAVGLIASALGIAAGLLIDWFPVGASKEAKPIDTLWDVLIIFSVPVFVLVVTVVLFSVWKFRMRPGEELLDGPPIHGNTRLEIVWTAIPAIILVGLCTYAFLVLHDVEKADAGQPLKVRVVGQQFAWSFHYMGANGKEIATASPQLYVPVGKQVEFTLQSKDVLHDFWVPAFRIKRDAVPGIDVKYRVTPSRIGTYPIVCAELCGLGHSTMRGSAHVLEPAQYDAWLKKLAAGPKPAGTPAGGGAAANGKPIFTSAGCAACHTLKDAGSTGAVGPDLDKVLKGRDPAFIKESIVDPDKVIAPGFEGGIMPGNFSQQLTPAQIDALVTYLSDVTKGG
jgi:cytochrome c oxidase subunit 2